MTSTLSKSHTIKDQWINEMASPMGMTSVITKLVFSPHLDGMMGNKELKYFFILSLIT